MSTNDLIKHIQKTEQRMLKHAHDLEFEEATRLRDEIKVLKDKLISLS